MTRPVTTDDDFQQRAALEDKLDRIGRAFTGELPQLRLYRAAPLSSTLNNGWQSTLFDAIQGDNDRGTLESQFDPLTGEAVCRIPGWYELYACVSFVPNVTGLRGVRMMLNQTDVTSIASRSENAANGTNSRPETSSPFRLNVGDRIQVQSFQNSGGTLAHVVNEPAIMRFAWSWVSP